MKNTLKLILAIASISLMAACGGGGDSESSSVSTSGGVCSGSGTRFNCQGRICTKSGNGVICPDGQFCPIPQNLSVTSNPVCARRN